MFILIKVIITSIINTKGWLLMESVKVRVAENLRKYRERRGITQKQLANHLGVRDNTISSWEKGTNSIDISTLLNICNFLEIRLDDIYGISDKKYPPLS